MAAQNYHSVAIILNFSVLPLGLFLLSRLLPLIIKPLWNWRQLWLHLLALILLAQKEKEGGSWQCIRHSALAHYSCAVFWGTILRILSILQYFWAIFCTTLYYSAVLWGVLSVELRVHQATCCGQFYYDGREESGTGPDIDLQTCILPPNTNTNTGTNTKYKYKYSTATRRGETGPDILALLQSHSMHKCTLYSLISPNDEHIKRVKQGG